MARFLSVVVKGIKRKPYGQNNSYSLTFVEFQLIPKLFPEY
jgi:hypothetical protein